MLSFPTHIWFGEVEDLETLLAEYVVKELEEDPGLVEVLSRQQLQLTYHFITVFNLI